MHIHMRPADLQHTQASQTTRRTTKSDASKADTISDVQDRNDHPRRERQSQGNGRGRPPNNGRNSLAAALAAFDVFGAETIAPQQEDAPVPEIAELLASMKI